MSQTKTLPELMQALTGATAPVFLKTEADAPWPADERLFYLLGRDGLYVCRNHVFFQSCVKTSNGPSDLEEQRPFLRPHFPRFPQALLEQTVGFFSRVAERHGSEAAALLLWDSAEERVRIVVPPQTATVSSSWNGYRSPLGVHYEMPADLPTGWIPYGDIHSHVEMEAYSSATDIADESHAAGLHIVVGRIHQEPPQLHCEAVVDGQRFAMPTARVVEGYRARSHEIPATWLERVTVEEVSWSRGPQVLS